MLSASSVIVWEAGKSQETSLHPHSIELMFVDVKSRIGLYSLPHIKPDIHSGFTAVGPKVVGNGNKGLAFRRFPG